ncbi:MAG: hypothetical protein Q9196_007148, partial [Gyalolechia fulgens]
MARKHPIWDKSGESGFCVKGCISIQSPTPVDWNGTSFRQWVGVEGENTTRNYISILALGWSYILSARLLEMQGQGGAEIEYTQSMATGYKRDVGDSLAAAITVDIGDVDDHAARWWAAILAPGQGWKAIVSRSEDVVYLSPWSVCVEDGQRFDIAWGGTSSPSQDSGILFATRPGKPVLRRSRNNTDFSNPEPLRNRCHATVPYPPDRPRRRESGEARCSGLGPNKRGASLLYGLELQSKRDRIESLRGLLGAGDPMQPRQPLVTPCHERIADYRGSYHEILAIMCAIRRPKLSALWLGAVTSGLAPRILDFVKGGTPPLDPNAFAWTGCPQSFMDLAGSGPYFQTEDSGEKIRRADAWRLLFLPTVVEDDLHYENYPFTPSEPVGKTSAENCMARVRIHRSCSRHHLTYQHWAWHLGDGSTLVDQGLETVPAQHSFQEVTSGIETPASVFLPVVELPLDQEASRTASWEIFQWVTANGEGIPADELIYKDEWLYDETVSEVPSSPQEDST